jgi:hypothetical protein
LLVAATSYPFLSVLWDILIFFAWVIFIWIAITVLIDVFRRHDISGGRKASGPSPGRSFRRSRPRRWVPPSVVLVRRWPI